MNAGQTPSLPIWLDPYVTFNYKVINKIPQGSLNVQTPGMVHPQTEVRPGTYIVQVVGNPEFLNFKQFNKKYKALNPEETDAVMAEHAAEGERLSQMKADNVDTAEAIQEVVNEAGKIPPAEDVIQMRRESLTLLTDEAYLRGVREAESKFAHTARQKIDAILRERLEPVFPKILQHHLQQIQLILNSLPINPEEGKHLTLNMSQFPSAFRYLILNELGLQESIYDKLPGANGETATGSRQDAAGPRQS